MPTGSIPLNLAADLTVSDNGQQPYPSQPSYGYVDPLNRSDNSEHRNTLSLSKYSFVYDAYHSTGGFESGYYLVPFITETMYSERRELATYKNYIRPLCDSMVNPVFSKPINRICKTLAGITLEESLYQSFILDCNNIGDGLTTIVRDIVHEAVLQGMSYCVMDNVEASLQPATEKEARNTRVFPYVYMMTQDDVAEYLLDKFGNIESITFTDTSVVVKDSEGREKTEARFRRWTKNESVILAERKQGDKMVMVPVESPVIHGLGVVPVYPCYFAKRSRNRLEVDSPMYDIAKLCWGVFNLDSERREVERKQGFSMLCIQGQPTTSISVGAGNVLFYDPEAKQAPTYASPDFNIIRVLREETDDMVKRIFEIAEQNGVTSVGGAETQTSGVAKEWDFRAREFILQDVAGIAKRLESWILSTFNLYTGVDIVCESKYPERFAPNSITTDLKDLDAMLLMNISPSASKYIKKQAFKAKFPDIDELTLQAIEDEIDSEIEEEKNNIEGDSAGKVEENVTVE